MKLDIAIACMKAEQPLIGGKGYSLYRYIVWNPAASIPTMVHKTKRLARDEAKRLAKKFPEATFIILKMDQVI